MLERRWKNIILSVLGSLGISLTQNCTFCKLDSWSPGAGFIPIISTKVINQINKGKLFKNKLSFMHTNRFNKFFKIWVQLCLGAIPRLPVFYLEFSMIQPFLWAFPIARTFFHTTHHHSSSKIFNTFWTNFINVIAYKSYSFWFYRIWR